MTLSIRRDDGGCPWCVDPRAAHEEALPRYEDVVFFVRVRTQSVLSRYARGVCLVSIIVFSLC
jgi:hypothetical protein